MYGKVLIAALMLAAAAGPVMAANARHPYQNVDRRNDAGNETGDARVDELNAGQLNQNYYRNSPQGGGATMPAPGAMPPRQ